jgi:hypothetical protein
VAFIWALLLWAYPPGTLNADSADMLNQAAVPWLAVTVPETVATALPSLFRIAFSSEVCVQFAVVAGLEQTGSDGLAA